MWLIDPGQSVPISREQHALAKDLIRVLSGTVDEAVGLRIVNGPGLNPDGIPNFFTLEELRALTGRKDLGDAFIKFVGEVKLKGGVVPLPVVQWVLGMNRQLDLNRKLGAGTLERRLFTRFAKDSLRSSAAPLPERCRNVYALVQAALKRKK